MIGYLWAALALAATASAAALGMALAVSRRLRVLREMLEAKGMLGRDLPEPGQPVPGFAMTTTAGEQITHSDLAGPDVLLLFLMEDCESCLDLVAALTDQPDSESRPIAVVIGDAGERTDLVGKLEPVARVVEDADPFGLAAVFGVNGFPAVLVVGGGMIRSASHRLSEIPIGLKR